MGHFFLQNHKILRNDTDGTKKGREFPGNFKFFLTHFKKVCILFRCVARTPERCLLRRSRKMGEVSSKCRRSDLERP